MMLDCRIGVAVDRARLGRLGIKLMRVRNPHLQMTV
jgi:hypothetical protein